MVSDNINIPYATPRVNTFCEFLFRIAMKGTEVMSIGIHGSDRRSGSGAEDCLHPGCYPEQWSDAGGVAHAGAEQKGYRRKQDGVVGLPLDESNNPQGMEGDCGSGEDLQAVRTKLLEQAAIRELGKNVLSYVLADTDSYVNWHIKRFGCSPAGF